MKSIQIDEGGEFSFLDPHLGHLGLNRRITCPCTFEHNRVSKSRHKRVVDKGLALLLQARLSPMFWDHSFRNVVYIVNRLPINVLHNRSPYQVLYENLSDYTFLRSFGYECCPCVRLTNRHKLKPFSISCIFLGYAPSHKGYLCYDVVSKRIYTCRHVLFNESIYPLQAKSIDPSILSSPDQYPTTDHIFVSIHPTQPSLLR